ncbi:hypothetical protein M5K25_018619 [Dendrobium thyrsiflorum]|uniref:Cytochrome b5 heme-binding domain-containing protein n=1 Tax=Dendrobium thyrsiflorum TaxID=117978 RepID=A0ABD0UJG7_DENTH
MEVKELWATLEHAIKSYTGLSTATFFTLVAVVVAFYYVVSAFFEPAPVPRKREVEAEAVEPLPPPVQLGEITEEELIAYDGSDPKKPLLMAIKGQIYDVTQSRMFYGPGGPYALFAGKDASRALAKMSFEQKDLTGDISDLGPFELEALQDWEYKFMSKYVKVGTVKKSAVPVTDGSESGNASEITDVGNQTTEGISRSDESVEVESKNPSSSAKDDIETVDRDAGFEIVAEPKLETEAVAEAKKIEKLKEDGDVEEEEEKKE